MKDEAHPARLTSDCRRVVRDLPDLLAAGDGGPVAAHLLQCEPCRRRIAIARRLAHSLRQPVQPPEELTSSRFFERVLENSNEGCESDPIGRVLRAGLQPVVVPDDVPWPLQRAADLSLTAERLAAPAWLLQRVREQVVASPRRSRAARRTGLVAVALLLAGVCGLGFLPTWGTQSEPEIVFVTVSTPPAGFHPLLALREVR